jgi:cell division protein FtsW (lipid II flippase)
VKTLLRRWPLAARPVELGLLALVTTVSFLGFALVAASRALQAGADPLPALGPALWPPAVLSLSLLAFHLLLRRRGAGEQLVLPMVGLLAAIGLVMVWRLRPPEVVWQQLTRGWLPGLALAALLVARVDLVERVRRDWPLLISLAGLLLLGLTAFFGVVDESGARLSLKLGPLPAIQTSEMVKLALMVFLAWFIDSEGERAEARALALGLVRLPAVKYVLPGALYVAIATLALVRMSDFGAILILGGLFVTMLYTGFEPRVFLGMAGVGLALALLAGLVLAETWQAPAVVQTRWAAFLNPWSQAPLVINGQPTGLTIAQGPGYQLQQAIYAVVAGGLTGAGLGYGLPQNVPLAHSDMIFAAVVEELGALVSAALLVLYALLLFRILRVALRLPVQQVFERLLLVGIGVHLFGQMFLIVAGTLNLLPLTGITLPFLSQGGAALLVNVVEIGIVLALSQRLEARPA